MKMTAVCLMCLSLCTPVFLIAQRGEKKVEIALAYEVQKEREQATKKQLNRLLQEYDLSKWIFTEKVLVDYYTGIPHSHPILTLNTRYVDDDERLLSTFVHEQIHWFTSAKPDAVDKTVAEFKTLYPEVPVGKGQGARDESSTYLHLIVCYLEFSAVTELLGEPKAREIMANWRHYKWIYKTVLNEGDKLKAVIEKNKLTI